MEIHGYELITEWKNSNCGQTARATRSGKVYFLKKYQTPVNSVRNGALDEKTFDNNKRKFDDYVALRKKLNTIIRSVAGAGGNIIIPAEEFVEDNHYVEASEYVDGVVGDEELEGVLSSLSDDVKKLLMLTAAGALDSVHSRGIIHSDLKLKNVLLVKNPSGNYVAKLIDFDNGYFADSVLMPSDIGGSIDYASPELSSYSNLDEEEDDWESEKGKMTVKSDIFSLGLIFHYYMAGELPHAKTLNERLQKRKDKGKPIYCCDIVNNGCEIEISDKITNLNYRSLLADMLSGDPGRRPTAKQVLMRLKARETEEVIEEPWEEHKIIIDKNKIKDGGYVVFKKVSTGGVKQYELMKRSGEKKNFTKEALISAGFAKAILTEKFDEPWEEHAITFNIDKIKSRGFVSLERTTLSGIKGYNLSRSDGTSRFFKVENLKVMGYARNKAGASSAASSGSSSSSSSSSSASSTAAVPTGFCEPWPEHTIEFDTDQAKRRGYVASEQVTMGGVKGYNFVRADGSKQFIKIEMLIIFKMAKAK